MNKRIKKKIYKRGGYKTYSKYRWVVTMWNYVLEHGNFEITTEGVNCIVTLPITFEYVLIDIVVSNTENS